MGNANPLSIYPLQDLSNGVIGVQFGQHLLLPILFQNFKTFIILQLPKCFSFENAWDSSPCTLPHLWKCAWVPSHIFGQPPFSCVSFNCEPIVRVTTFKMHLELNELIDIMKMSKVISYWRMSKQVDYHVGTYKKGDKWILHFNGEDDYGFY
jgi:hypothetical protein